MTEPPRQVAATRVYLMTIAALLVGLMVGLVLPAVFPAFAGLGPAESCTEVQNEYHEIRRELDGAEGDDVEEPATALSGLLERRPDCLGDHDRELIEDFRMFLDG